MFELVKGRKFDLLNAKETIKLAHAFFSGKELVQMYKQKQPGKKIVSVSFPFSELVYAMDAIPLNLVRYEDFTYKGMDGLLRYLTTITKTLGWNSIDSLLKLAYFTRSGADLVDFFVDNMITAYNERTAFLTKLAEKNGFPVDSCFGSRLMYGMNVHNSKIVDASIDWVYRCPFFYKYYDSLGGLVKNNYIVDVPLDSGEVAEKTLEADFMELVSMLETVTGNKFSEERLAEAITITNELKALYKEILFVISKNGVIPYNPLTFSEVQALLMFSYVDFNSNLKAYRSNVKNLYAEMLRRVDQGLGFDATGHAKILYMPMFTGLEQENLKMLARFDAEVIFADWEVLGMLEPVSTTGNVVRNFIRHFLRLNQYFGPSSELLSNSMIRVARELDVDGVLFQGTFACKNIGPVLKMFKEKARASGIPVVETSFNNVGENVEQNKTRLEAFMEMIKA
ncbi:MAG TPA: 2-hydroxyacyl-CoA dehydratase family protein [Candidatus Lokiarchaeia archaeon]|nr:2-hydroxyacyl-CoA dehydratase family protein [Candidatus Lokiarchaeia archaeon]